MLRDFYKVSFDKKEYIIDKRYANLKPIGNGAYGTVFMADDLVYIDLFVGNWK